MSYLDRHVAMLRLFAKWVKSCRELGASDDELCLHLEGRIHDLRTRRHRRALLAQVLDRSSRKCSCCAAPIPSAALDSTATHRRK